VAETASIRATPVSIETRPKAVNLFFIGNPFDQVLKNRYSVEFIFDIFYNLKIRKSLLLEASIKFHQSWHHKVNSQRHNHQGQNKHLQKWVSVSHGWDDCQEP
jgi:hypothetical protein